MSDLKSIIIAQINTAGPGHVWVPADFAQIGNRDAIDKTLQRMVQAGDLRRIDRGLYDRPTLNKLTKRPTTPDYRAVVEAVARRDQLRLLVDGMTAANDLGLTDAVPARVTIHTDARRRAIQLDNLTIDFKQTAPSRLYWAGRPAMRVVQALHWLKDTLVSDRDRILRRLAQVLADPTHGAAIRQDLIDGFGAMPAWMQSLVRELPGCDQQLAAAKTPQPHNGRSQAVRLPAAYRFDTKEVFIRQDTETGDVILSRKPATWDDFFAALKGADVPANFLDEKERNQGAQDRDPFEESSE